MRGADSEGAASGGQNGYFATILSAWGKKVRQQQRQKAKPTHPRKYCVYFLFRSMISRCLCWKCMRYCIIVGKSGIEEIFSTLVRLLGKGFLPSCPWTTMLTTSTCGKAGKRTRVSLVCEKKEPKAAQRGEVLTGLPTYPCPH